MNTAFMNIRISNIFNRRNRILLAELVRTDFKLRYQASSLGYLWSILSPLLLFAILYIVFDRFLGLGRDIDFFPVYLLTGIVLWRFFTEATNNGLKAIVQRGGLIRKINFPRYIVVISGTVSSLINLAINLVVVFIFVLLAGVPLSWNALLVIPLIIELYVFALALAFFLSAVNVKMRDISHLWEIFLQAAFYATPIIYPLALVANQSQLAAQILLTSPVAQVIQDVRYVFITTDTLTMARLTDNIALILTPFLVIVLATLLGAWYFKRSQGKFAEEV
jgi:ABC-2 type transport system permease protein